MNPLYLHQVPRNRQPQGQVVKLAPWVPAGTIAYVGGDKSVIGAGYAESGTVVKKTTHGGIAANSSTTASYIDLGPVPAPNITGHTVIVQFIARDTSARAIAGERTAALFHQIQVNVNNVGDPSAGRLFFITWNLTTSKYLRFATTNSVLSVGKLHTAAFTIIEPQIGKIFLDGAEQAVSHANAASYSAPTGLGTAFHLLNDGDNALGTNVDLLLFIRIPNVLGSRFNFKELTATPAAPWQLFEDDRLILPFGVTSGLAFDAAANSGDQAATNTYSGSASWAGSDRLLAIDVSMLGAGVTVTSMTYGGAACTFIGAQSTVTSFGRVEQWRIVQADSGAPAAGSNTLVVNLSGSLEFVVEWTSYTGVHQTVPTEAFNSAQATNAGSATDASVNVTSIADNCLVHAAVVANDTSITAGNTSRNNISGTLGSGANEDNGAPKTPAGSVAMSYTGMGITTTWAIAGYAIRPVAAAGSGFFARWYYDLMGAASV